MTALDYTVADHRAGRSLELVQRIATHESGHAVCARALGSVVEQVTIVPGDGYVGQCVRRGSPGFALKPSALRTLRKMMS
jgi:hypothetical protein